MTTALPNTQTKTNSSSALAQEAVVETNFEAASASFDKKTMQYARIAQAIEYIQKNFQAQPSLSEMAAAAELSPSHFQKLFTDWAGTSPKKFVQYLSLSHAKSILKNNQQGAMLDATYDTGLSSPSRLHDLFVQIEGMTPSEYREGGKHLSIDYEFATTPFGEVLIASTQKGICHMAFFQDQSLAIDELKSRFPNATYRQQSNEKQLSALAIFSQTDPAQAENSQTELEDIKLHLKGTDFQLKVWESLLNIPQGQLRSYGEVADAIGKPTASRAVGTAIGKNPIAFIIPCHRVIKATGAFGDYRWGSTRKSAIIGWEGSHNHVS